MKSRLFTFISILSLFILSCSKDNLSNLPQELRSRTVQPLKYVIDNKMVVDSLVNYYGGVHELGIRFRSSSDGIIKELGLNSPESGKFNISVWDMETQTRLATAQVVTVANEFIYQPIQDLKIEAQKEYVLSFHNYENNNGLRYYLARNKTGKKIYPFSAYGIEFLDFRYRSGNDSKFPIGVAELEQDNLPGILDFKIELASVSPN